MTVVFFRVINWDILLTLRSSFVSVNACQKYIYQWVTIFLLPWFIWFVYHHKHNILCLYRNLMVILSMKYVGQTCDLHIHRSEVWSINVGLTKKQAIKMENVDKNVHDGNIYILSNFEWTVLLIFLTPYEGSNQTIHAF